MKIKIVNKSYDEVMALPTPAHHKPQKMRFFFKNLIKILSATTMKGNHLSYTEHDMDRLEKNEPCLVLMNHSCFADMKIAANYLYPRPFSTVCTTDAYIGMPWLMKTIGCIPTPKFVSDFSLIKDMLYALKELKTTVLMYPEACYSFDGKASTLPDSLGGLLKLLKVPVVTMITHGAFLRDPLYNMLQHRKIDIQTDVTYLLSPDEIEKKSREELNDILQNAFSFDSFKWQQDHGIVIAEKFRADGLHRVLYKCPHCYSEGFMQGKGTTITCHACHKTYSLTELGELVATDGDSAFTHIPDWFEWEREEVKREIKEDNYRMDVEVDVYMMVDYKAIYRVGEGMLHHQQNGFHLTGCDGRLDYVQSSVASYTINSDYFWYEIGDVISIGNKRHLFFCIPKDEHAVVAKAKLAAEELYKIKKKK